MFDSKFISTLIALVVAVIAICNFNTKKVSSNEEFGFGNLPSMTWKVGTVAAPSKEAAMKGHFVSVPNFQANLSPRFKSESYGANINYNIPSYENLAVPIEPMTIEPMTFGNMAKENFTIENYPSSCGRGGVDTKSYGGAPMMKADYASGNYNELVNQVNSDFPSVTNTLPMVDMTALNPQGESVNVYTAQNFIYANRNSRLRSQGDPIRGDLPIVPCAAEWFRPSVQTNIDLQQGAMNVLGGNDNSTTQALAQLINSTSGDTTIAGVNMATSKDLSTDGMMSTVNVTAFA